MQQSRAAVQPERAPRPGEMLCRGRRAAALPSATAWRAAATSSSGKLTAILVVIPAITPPYRGRGGITSGVRGRLAGQPWPMTRDVIVNLRPSGVPSSGGSRSRRLERPASCLVTAVTQKLHPTPCQTGQAPREGALSADASALCGSGEHEAECGEAFGQAQPFGGSADPGLQERVGGTVSRSPVHRGAPQRPPVAAATGLGQDAEVSRQLNQSQRNRIAAS